MMEIVKIEGFYGRIKKKKADKLLHNCQKGVYLLRLSGSTKGDWVKKKIKKKKKIKIKKK